MTVGLFQGLHWPCVMRRVRAGRDWGQVQHHDFDKTSGWCIHGCGMRDDGRRVGKGGAVEAVGTSGALL